MICRLAAICLAAIALLYAPLAAADPATETEHIVQDGETLGGIANRAGVPMSAIARANDLKDPYRVRIGQKLRIPRQRSHVVKPNETGFGIAMQYGVPFALIAQANGFATDAILKVGQELKIPAMMRENVNPRIVAPDPKFRRPHDGAWLLGFRVRSDGGGHEGLDIAVQSGDMIRAAETGTVIFAGDEPVRFGKLVVIDHGNGWHSAYGHLSRVTVKRGDTVKVGERIGLGGQSGDADKPELHFEIRNGNSPVDPATRIAAPD